MPEERLLAVRGLTVEYPAGDRRRPALAGLDLDLAAGEIVALLGVSGSGKSTLGAALLGLVTPGGRVRADSASFAGREVAVGPQGLAPALRGRSIAWAPQDSAGALHPLRSLLAQARDAIRPHRVPREARRPRIEREWRRFALDPALLERYPHELSGGERQRALLALAALTPARLWVLDEPTAALDPPLRLQVLDTLARRREEEGIAILFATQDGRAARRLCDRAVLLEGGRLAAAGPVGALADRLAAPRPPDAGGPA